MTSPNPWFRVYLDRLIVMDEVQALSVREAAKLLGVAPSTIWRRRQRMPIEADDDGMVRIPLTVGADGRRRPSRRIPPIERNLRILQLRQQGRSIRAIADEVGCAASTVHKLLSRIPDEDERQSVINALSRIV
jgi:IS30 family transposase